MSILTTKDHTIHMRDLDDGRVCIHWLVEDDSGPIQMESDARLRAVAGQKPTVRGRIACNPTQNTVQPQHKGRDVYVCFHSGDVVHAVSCPACLATPEAIEVRNRHAEFEAKRGVPSQQQ